MADPKDENPPPTPREREVARNLGADIDDPHESPANPENRISVGRRAADQENAEQILANMPEVLTGAKPLQHFPAAAGQPGDAPDHTPLQQRVLDEIAVLAEFLAVLAHVGDEHVGVLVRQPHVPTHALGHGLGRAPADAAGLVVETPQEAAHDDPRRLQVVRGDPADRIAQDARTMADAAATVSAIGSFMIPEMEEKGYDKGYATALSAAAGTIGVIIPPSVPFVIYGVTTGTSITDLFKAGVVPGVAMGAHAAFLCMREDGPVTTKPEALHWNEAAALLFGGMTALHYLRQNRQIAVLAPRKTPQQKLFRLGHVLPNIGLQQFRPVRQ